MTDLSPFQTRYARPLPSSLAHVLKFAALATAGMVAFESLTPSGAVQSINHMDKVVHACVYFVLGGLFAAAWHRSSLVFIFLVTAAFGAGLEIGQGAMNLGRTASLADQIANTFGAGLGVLLWVGFIRAKEKRRFPEN